MRLRSLSISNFRNLARAELEFGDGLHVICGANGQGKTNLLEAVFYLVTGRSFRSHLDGAVLPHGAEPDAVARVEGMVQRAGGGRNRLAVAIGQNVKRVWIDDKAVGQLGELWGKLRAVLFTPDDVNVLKQGPALRRRLLDVALSQLEPAYLTALQNYTRALRQRNVLLRTESYGGAARAQIAAFNQPLAQWGAAVHATRARFIDELAACAAAAYERIAPGGETLGLRYLHTFKEERVADEAEARERLLALLDAGLPHDLRRRQTLRGIHREDLHFAIDGHDIRHFGSQGQLRTAMLALRLAELELMERWSGEPPILLLDDLASELDAERRARLFASIEGRAQTLLTTTDPALLGAAHSAARVFNIHAGALQSAEE